MWPPELSGTSLSGIADEFQQSDFGGKKKDYLK